MEQMLPLGLGIGITFMATLYLCSRKGRTDKISEKQEQTTKPKTIPQVTQIKEVDEEKKKKKKKKKGEGLLHENAKSVQEIQSEYKSMFYGNINLKPSGSIHHVTALAAKTSKILLANTKNQLILYCLKNWKKDGKNNSPEKYFTSLDNNGASAVAIGQKFYYAALTFDRTLAYYEFKGGQKGVYFQQVKKFPRNILKGEVSSLSVPEGEKYIITTGSEADTVIDIWSMNGQKLTTMNSYQIEHYQIKYGCNSFLIRGWTSEVKIFTTQKSKDDSFKKIQKTFHLAHNQNPISASIDNLDLYALTVSKSDEVKLWPLNWGYSSGSVSMHANPITIDSFKIELDQVKKCQIHTIKTESERYKTIIVLTDGIKIVILDKNFSIQKILEGIDCQDLYLIGSKSLVMGTINKAGKLFLWNLTEIVNEMKEYQI